MGLTPLAFALLVSLGAACLGAVCGWLGGMGVRRAHSREIAELWDECEALSTRLSKREGRDGRAKSLQTQSNTETEMAYLQQLAASATPRPRAALQRRDPIEEATQLGDGLFVVPTPKPTKAG